MTHTETIPTAPRSRAESRVEAFEQRIHYLMALTRNRVFPEWPGEEDEREAEAAVDRVHLQEAFERLADRLHRHEIRPRLEAVARCFAGARIEHFKTLAGTLSVCALAPGGRFPAATLTLGVVFDSTRMAASVVYSLQSVPALLELEWLDSLPVALDQPHTTDAVASWLEGKLEAFIRTYFRIEREASHEPLELHTDPVCGMRVAAVRALCSEHAGRPFYFCAPACRTAFEADPSRFAERRSTATA